MSLMYDMIPYTDKSGLMSNQLSNGQFRTSDNGTLFSSEYIILLQKRKEMFLSDKQNYQKVIQSCVGQDGELHRAPGDVTPDTVDDHYGVYSAHVFLDLVPTFNLPFRLWYQPGLVFAWRCAAQKFKWYKIHYLPLALITSLVIATSCMFTNKNESTPRKLAYLLIQATQGSLLCRIGSYFWFRRLLKTYPNGMLDVYTLFFGSSHPMSKYSLLK